MSLQFKIACARRVASFSRKLGTTVWTILILDSVKREHDRRSCCPRITRTDIEDLALHVPRLAQGLFQRKRRGGKIAREETTETEISTILARTALTLESRDKFRVIRSLALHGP